MIQEKIGTIESLQKEAITLKRDGAKQIRETYEKQKKNREMQEFYDTCLEAYSKKLIKMHEINILSNLKNFKSEHSYLLELLRKKYI